MSHTDVGNFIKIIISSFLSSRDTFAKLTQRSNHQSSSSQKAKSALCLFAVCFNYWKSTTNELLIIQRFSFPNVQLTDRLLSLPKDINVFLTVCLPTFITNKLVVATEKSPDCLFVFISNQ